MRANEATVRLADLIADRRVSGGDNVSLFLGAGVSRATGGPSAADVGREVFAQLREDPGTQAGLIPRVDASDAEVAAAFRALLLSLEPIERAGLTLQVSANVPVPQFMQDLAALVRDGCFTTVLTTSFGALLERALAGAGLYIDRDYDIVDVSEHAEPPGLEDRRGITLVKIHGGALTGAGKLVEHALGSTLAIVGHEPSDPPLGHALADSDCPIWWVAPQAPPDSELAALRESRRVEVVDGVAADPDRFFGELSLLLVQMPAVNILSQGPESLGKARAVARQAEATSVAMGVGLGTVASAVLASVGGTAPPDDELEFERQFMRGRLQRAREALRKLEEEVAGGTADEGVQRQLEYQRRVVLGLEARLKELESERERVVELLHAVRAAADASGDPSIGRFVSSLVDQVEAEFASPQPNEDIVSATLGAVTIVADRVGLDSAIVRELAHHAPTHPMPL